MLTLRFSISVRDLWILKRQIRCAQKLGCAGCVETLSNFIDPEIYRFTRAFDRLKWTEGTQPCGVFDVVYQP